MCFMSNHYISRFVRYLQAMAPDVRIVQGYVIQGTFEDPGTSSHVHIRVLGEQEKLVPLRDILSHGHTRLAEKVYDAFPEDISSLRKPYVESHDIDSYIIQGNPRNNLDIILHLPPKRKLF